MDMNSYAERVVDLRLRLLISEESPEAENLIGP